MVKYLLQGFDDVVTLGDVAPTAANAGCHTVHAQRGCRVSQVHAVKQNLGGLFQCAERDDSSARKIAAGRGIVDIKIGFCETKADIVHTGLDDAQRSYIICT